MIPTALQRILIQYILRPLSAPLTHLSEKSRQNLIFACSLGFFLVHFLYSYFVSLRFLYFFVLDCFLLGIIILCGVTPKIAPVRWKAVFSVSWLCVAVFTCIAAVLYKADYLTDGIIYLVALPIFWMVWGQRDCDPLFHGLIRAAKWSFWLLLPILTAFYPISGAGYKAFWGNPNGLSVYLTVVFCAFLFDCLTLPQIGVKAIIDYLSAGLCAALIYYTASRGGEFVCIIALVLTVGMLAVCQGKKALRHILCSVLPILLSTALCIPTALYVMYAGYEGVADIRSVFTAQPAETPGVPSSDETPVEIPSEVPGEAPDLDSITDFNKQKIVDSAQEGLYTYTSWRSELWTIYGSRLTPFGHDGSETLYFSDGREVDLSPHLTVLNIGYDYGFIAGVCYLLFNIATGFYCILYALRRRVSIYGLFPFLFTAAFGAYSLVESINSPFICVISLIYYLVQAPIVLKDAPTENKEISPKESRIFFSAR